MKTSVIAIVAIAFLCATGCGEETGNGDKEGCILNNLIDHAF